MNTTILSTENEIQKLRDAIDQVDEVLIETLLARFKIVSEIADYKKKHNTFIPTYIPSREQEIIRRLTRNMTDKSHIKYVQYLYSHLFATTRHLQAQFSIGVFVKGHDHREAYLMAVSHFGDFHDFDLEGDPSTLEDVSALQAYDFLIVDYQWWSTRKTHGQTDPFVEHHSISIKGVATQYVVLSTIKESDTCDLFGK